MSANLLDLIRGYGLQEREDAGSTREPMSPKAQALFDRIAALVQQDDEQHRRVLNDCTHGADCLVHPEINGLHNFDPPYAR